MWSEEADAAGYKLKIDPNKITYTLHQIWPSYHVPAAFKDSIKSWKKNNPDWEYWFWTPREVKALLSRHFPNYASLYDDYPGVVYRTDVARYFILYTYGGVYADIDMDNLRPMESWMSAHQCLLSEDTYEHTYFVYNRARPNVMTSLMACRPKHPFFNMVISSLPLYAAQSDVLEATGPFFLDKVYTAYEYTDRNDVSVIPPDYFLPTHDPIVHDLIVQKCEASREHLTVQQQILCKKHKTRDFSNDPEQYSYTAHHWLPVGTENDAGQDTVNIFDIMPEAVKVINIINNTFIEKPFFFDEHSVIMP